MDNYSLHSPHALMSLFRWELPDSELPEIVRSETLDEYFFKFVEFNYPAIAEQYGCTVDVNEKRACEAIHENAGAIIHH